MSGGHQHWSAVAVQRGKDADALHAANRNLATVYMLGYVAESLAKVMLLTSGRPLIKDHDIRLVLESAGVDLRRLPVDARRFAEERSVSMRYEVDFDGDYDSTRAAAIKLCGWLSVRTNRRRRRS